jgi:hypothetical protein
LTPGPARRTRGPRPSASFCCCSRSSPLASPRSPISTRRTPWISGYRDDDDFDSAIDAILNACAVEPGPLDAFGLQWTLVSRIVALAVNTSAPPVETADAPRGPPAALPTTA